MMTKHTQTFALYFGNRGFFPETLIASARDEVSSAVKAAGFDFIMPPAEMTRYGAVETKDEGLVYAKWLSEHRGEYDGLIMSLPNFSDENGAVARIDTVVVSTQHDPDIALEELRGEIIEKVIRAALPAELLDENTRMLVNPTGRFVIGGPVGDSGLTGRKIIVDTYGGMASHGGGAFSGKDPTKVDRSAAYMTRYIAKNIVAAGLARKCQIEVAYAIGVASPVSILVDTYGTGRVSDDKLVDIVKENFDLRPASIISCLDLRRPIYKSTAAYGHFGRTDAEFSWEKTDKAEALRKYIQ